MSRYIVQVEIKKSNTSNFRVRFIARPEEGARKKNYKKKTHLGEVSNIFHRILLFCIQSARRGFIRPVQVHVNSTIWIIYEHRFHGRSWNISRTREKKKGNPPPNKIHDEKRVGRRTKRCLENDEQHSRRTRVTTRFQKLVRTSELTTKTCTGITGTIMIDTLRCNSGYRVLVAEAYWPHTFY